MERNNFVVIYEGNFIFCPLSLYRWFSATTLREKQSIHPLSILPFCSRYTCFSWRTTDEDDGNRTLVMVLVLVSVMISCNWFLMLSTNFNRSVSNSKSSCQHVLCSSAVETNEKRYTSPKIDPHHLTYTNTNTQPNTPNFLNGRKLYQLPTEYLNYHPSTNQLML